MRTAKVEDLPALEITKKELQTLPEYSCSFPSGAHDGLKIKRNLNFWEREKEPIWLVGEYFPHKEKPGFFDFMWYRPIFGLINV